ncbi:hypothetical protein F5B20DRAFT_566297 [Whalleya microplaca]|nr:hypothetical protein F5B20DRAFT_566297 [Whalleya microplaca]
MISSRASKMSKVGVTETTTSKYRAHEETYRDRKDLRHSICVIIPLLYGVWTGVESYSRYEVWEATTTYDKISLAWGVISGILVMVSSAWAVWLYRRIGVREA